jgi:uncharacterized UPF0160 family protein
LVSQPKVQKKIKDAEGREKATIFFQELIQFNEDFFQNIIKKADSKNMRKNRMKKKIKTIKKEVLKLKKHISKDGESIIEEIVKKRENNT